MLNRVQLIVNTGKEPETGTTTSGSHFARFSVATTEKWRDKETGETKEKTEWHRVVCWGEGLVKYLGERLKKGSPVYVEGKLVTRAWKDDNGVERYSTEIGVQGFDGRIQIWERRENGRQPPMDNAEPPPSRGGGGLDDRIPF